MSVTAATLYRPTFHAASEPFQPGMNAEAHLDDFGYVEEEWFATGEENGHPYTTTLLVRRPRDAERFSGTVIVEPLHLMPIAPMYSFTSTYILRSGHAWACVASQKTVVESGVIPSDPARYASLRIEGDPLPPEAADLNFAVLPAERESLWWEQLRRQNRASNTILAQVGAAIKASMGPFEGFSVAHLPLMGHSGTGFLLSHYMREAHQSFRLEDGSPVYDGYFPSGWPMSPFGAYDVPVVQVITQGDYSSDNTTFFRPGYEGLGYRRPDSDEPGDRFRLYELAAFAHTSTQYPPINDVEFLKHIGSDVPEPGLRMSALPFNQVFQVALDHLVRWIADGVVPPRAGRLEMGADGWFVKDAHGNSVDGVRCAETDVPRATYIPNPTLPSGKPGMGSFGFERPFDSATMQRLYGDKTGYLQRFNRRLDELVAEGWFLAGDAEESRALAEKVEPF